MDIVLELMEETQRPWQPLPTPKAMLSALAHRAVAITFHPRASNLRLSKSDSRHCKRMETSGIRSEDILGACFCLGAANLPIDFVLLPLALEKLNLGRTVGLDNYAMATLRCGTSAANAIVTLHHTIEDKPP